MVSWRIVTPPLSRLSELSLSWPTISLLPDSSMDRVDAIFSPPTKYIQRKRDRISLCSYHDCLLLQAVSWLLAADFSCVFSPHLIIYDQRPRLLFFGMATRFFSIVSIDTSSSLTDLLSRRKQKRLLSPRFQLTGQSLHLDTQLSLYNSNNNYAKIPDLPR